MAYLLFRVQVNYLKGTVFFVSFCLSTKSRASGWERCAIYVAWCAIHCFLQWQRQSFLVREPTSVIICLPIFLVVVDAHVYFLWQCVRLFVTSCPVGVDSDVDVMNASEGRGQMCRVVTA